MLNSIMEESECKSPLQMLQEEGALVKCAAPMVRYSKWGCDFTFTPMIICKDFNASQFARDVEFTTNKYDRPLVTQFAADNAAELSEAALKVSQWCDGVDINCGCPQRWAIAEGYGCSLLQKPELIADMVKQTKSRANLPVSIKIRVDPDLRKTVELAQRAESVGCAWISVHGRTPRQKSTTAVNVEAIRLVKESVEVPVIANGSVFTLSDALQLQKETNVNGVMAARGLLQNPALFSGYERTPMECVEDWINIALSLGTPTKTLHKHLMFMLFQSHSRQEKLEFNNLRTLPSILEFFRERGQCVSVPKGVEKEMEEKSSS